MKSLEAGTAQHRHILVLPLTVAFRSALIKLQDAGNFRPLYHHLDYLVEIIIVDFHN